MVEFKPTVRKSIWPRVIVDKLDRFIFVTLSALDSVATFEFVVERPLFTLESAAERLERCPFVTFRELLSVVTFAFVVVRAVDKLVIAI